MMEKRNIVRGKEWEWEGEGEGRGEIELSMQRC